MKPVQWAARAVVATALTLSVVGLSQVPWRPVTHADAALRLAWSYRSALVDRCRTLTPQELAKLPVHMRRATSCERRLMPYSLVVRVDGALVVDDSVHARGARADRPLSLFRELPLAHGSHRLRVEFAPLAPPRHERPREHDDDDDHERRAAIPPTLVLDTVAEIGGRRVVLVTLDEAKGQLILR